MLYLYSAGTIGVQVYIFQHSENPSATRSLAFFLYLAIGGFVVTFATAAQKGDPRG